MHLCFKHLTMGKSFSNHTKFNVAADAEVNSYIKHLPEGCIRAEMFGLETCKGTKYYYDNIPDPPGGWDQFDKAPGNHEKWESLDGLSDAEKQLIENQIDHIAKITAEQIQKCQGNIPAELSEYIGNLFKQKERVFDWKAYFRRMIGVIQSIELRKSRKKESLRFPDASSIKHKRKVNIAVVVDTSGSVSNQELCDFFSEINHVHRAGGNVTIIENDAAIQRIYQYNGHFDGKVSGRGGKIVPPSIVIY